ncbi:hypothetical protein T492DRAFT_869994 [Pavlovales sp. CCMP2436]|nr:hypothetical protein T492DRAFT_869994 [Pavlovales sp. CCMP2436]
MGKAGPGAANFEGEAESGGREIADSMSRSVVHLDDEAAILASLGASSLRVAPNTTAALAVSGADAGLLAEMAHARDKHVTRNASAGTGAAAMSGFVSAGGAALNAARLIIAHGPFVPAPLNDVEELTLEREAAEYMAQLNGLNLEGVSGFKHMRRLLRTGGVLVYNVCVRSYGVRPYSVGGFLSAAGAVLRIAHRIPTTPLTDADLAGAMGAGASKYANGGFSSALGAALHIARYRRAHAPVPAPLTDADLRLELERGYPDSAEGTAAVTAAARADGVLHLAEGAGASKYANVTAL